MAYTMTPRPHIVRVPRHMILLRIFQLVIATVILAVTAYGAYILSASGILLTLVTGRPYNPSYHAEDFITTSHGNTTNGTDVSSATTFLDSTNGTVAGNFSIVGEGTSVNGSLIPKFTGVQVLAPAVTQALAPHILDPQDQESGLPRLAPQVSKRDIKPGNSFPDILIPFSEMDLKELCYHPAHLEALESAYLLQPSLTQAAPSVPSGISDWHEGLHNSEYLTLTGSVHPTSRLVKRVFHNLRRDFQANKDYIEAELAKSKGYREILNGIARENWARRKSGLNDWGSPVKNAMLLPPHWLMTGHIQTALLSTLHLSLVLLTTHCPTFAPYYDYPLLFILESFLLVLWLMSFCILGAQVAVARAIGYGTACGEDGYCYTYASWDKRKHFLHLMAAAATLSAMMCLLYLISFSIFTVSVLKHRREGGMKKPISAEASHPRPFSLNDTRDAEEATNSATDEEAMQHGRQGRRGRHAERDRLSKKAEKEVKKFEKAAAKEDRRAIRNMRKGGLPKEKPTILSSGGGIFGPEHAEEGGERSWGTKEEKKKEKKEDKRSYKWSLRGWERKHMQKGLGMSEVEPAAQAPYQWGN